MSTFRKKLPIELDHTFMCFIKHRYSKESRLFIVPKKYPGATKIEEKETYWLPEKHSVINGAYMAYYSEHRTKDFSWKPADDMKKAEARYGLECHKIETKKLKAVKKSELVKSGITPELHNSADDTGITSDFANRPREFWRFKKRWEREFEEYAEWDDATEVLVFHFEIHRFQPELQAFDWHIEEQLLQKQRAAEYQARFEAQAKKDADDEKNGRKKRKKKKSGRKKKVNKKTTKKKK